jgi:hypothetical protein
LAGRLGPKEAGEAAVNLIQVMTKTMDPSLAHALSVLAGRLGPKEAGEVTATLCQAMTKTMDSGVLQRLAEGLSALADRLEPEEAKEAAATLCQAMTKTMDSGVLQRLAEDLSVVLHSEYSGWNASPRYRLLGGIGTLTGPASLLLAPALFRPPPPLPAQTLVDLLKQPFCVGEARRLVLEQLARHYQRPFVNQWDFARFAQEQKLDLDLFTPPQRPEVATPGR